MHTHRALDGRVLVLEPSGHLLGGPETEEFVNVAREFANREGVAVLVDFDGVDFMNSLALGALARILITYSRQHGWVKVCNVKGRVRALFDVVKFDRLFDYHDSEAAALDALSREMANPV